MFDSFCNKQIDPAVAIKQAIEEARLSLKEKEAKKQGVWTWTAEEQKEMDRKVQEAVELLPVAIKASARKGLDHTFLIAKDGHLKVRSGKDPLFVKCKARFAELGFECELTDYMSNDFLVKVNLNLR